MKTPMLLVGAAVIFWGWETGLLILALPMAVILEVARFFPSRWDLSADDFRRIANLCLIILIALLLYLIINNHALYFIYNLLQWLPGIFFPILVAQIYSSDESIDIRTLFFLLDKLTKEQKSDSFTVNLTYPYFTLCIFAASAANIRDISFYSGMVLLTGAALWFVRSKRFSPLVWLCLILIAVNLGFVGQIGLYQLHLTLENAVVAWLTNAYANGQELDSLKKQTSIGDIGLLKQSNEIVFRVASSNQKPPPRLLREATYNKYQLSSWVALIPNFTPVQPDSDGKTWHLGDKSDNNSAITVSATLQGGKGLLRLPSGTFQIDSLPVSQMEKNQYGTVKVAGKVESVSYRIQFDQSLSLDSLPTEDDLQVPLSERAALNQILSQLQLKGKSPEKILQQVDVFFLKNFSYSLKLVGKDKLLTPLSTFLLQTRSGHCEYFATATTLLLRAAGIPARYAVGYSVHEFSPLENQYIVRSRHAHSWTLAYVDGRWQALDTTPADWTMIEDANASKWVFISDLWSLLGFKLSGWLRQIGASNKLEWLLLPLILILIWRFSRWKGVRRLSAKQRRSTSPVKYSTGTNSEFYLIERTLNELGFIRHPSESLKNWIERLKDELTTSGLIDELASLIELYYRSRFDPQEIKETEKAFLRSSIQSWLDKYRVIDRSPKP